jgi:signal peptidase I
MVTESCAATERRRTIVFLATCGALALLCAPFRLGIVLGESMSPSFHTGQVFVTTRVDTGTTVSRGDVVLVTVNGQLYLKRVHALGGDTFWALQSPRSGAIERVFGAQARGPVSLLAWRHPGPGRLVEITVPDGYVYVLGDAESNSYDSRRFGAVPMESVKARVVVSRLFSLWAAADAGQHVAMAGEAPPARDP